MTWASPPSPSSSSSCLVGHRSFTLRRPRALPCAALALHPSRFQHLYLKHDGPLPNFAFNCGAAALQLGPARTGPVAEAQVNTSRQEQKVLKTRIGRYTELCVERVGGRFMRVLHHETKGGALQVDPGFPQLNHACLQLMELLHDERLPNFGFKLNLRQCAEGCARCRWN